MSGCSGGAGVTDMLGMGKNVPDERAVRTHQVLAMPPDLTLKPPAPAGETGTANAAAEAAAAAVGSQALHTPPEEVLQNAQGAPTSRVAQPAPVQTAAVQPAPVVQAPAANATAAQGAAASTQDVYQQYGISRTNPDGTLKSEAQLASELKQKRLERERAKNPNYGSIWNIGNIFSE